jgi:hypothetical protein
VVNILDRLVDALKTPSLSVQTSVAKCLPALMPLPVVGDHHERLVKQCLTLLLEGDGYGQRKGAAFGLAAMVCPHALFTLVLRQYYTVLLVSRWVYAILTAFFLIQVKGLKLSALKKHEILPILSGNPSILQPYLATCY